MNNKITLLTTGIFILFIGFVIFFVNKSIEEENDNMDGISEEEYMEDMETDEVNNINQSDLLKDINNPDVMIIDLRESNLFAKSHIPNSINIPFAEFENRIQELDSKKNIILVCHIGRMGEESAKLLLQKGFSLVSNLSGGMEQWDGPLEN